MAEFVPREEFKLFSDTIRDRFEAGSRRMDALTKRLDALPDKKDLDYQTETINTRITSLKEGLIAKQTETSDKAKEVLEERERKASHNRWLIGIVMLVVLAVLKKFGVL